MSKSAYIKLVKRWKTESISLEEVKNLFSYRRCVRHRKTATRWGTQEAAFPYDLQEREQDGIPYLLLKKEKNRATITD